MMTSSKKFVKIKQDKQIIFSNVVRCQLQCSLRVLRFNTAVKLIFWSFCISIVDLATRTVHFQSIELKKEMSLFGMEQIQKLEKTLESYPSINSALVSLEKKTKIQKLYLIYGNYLYIFAIFLDTYFLCNFLGCTLLQACILVRLQFLSALSSCFSQLI